MNNFSLQFTDALSHSMKKALKSNLFIVALAAAAAAFCTGLSNPANFTLAFAASALLAALLLYFADPFGYLRMRQLLKKAAARVEISPELLLVEMRDGSTLRFDRVDCCEKLSFEPNARMHGYYLSIHRADGSEVCVYTSAKTSERDALHQALNGRGATPYEYPCGARPACSSCPDCNEKNSGSQPLMA